MSVHQSSPVIVDCPIEYIIIIIIHSTEKGVQTKESYLTRM